MWDSKCSSYGNPGVSLQRYSESFAGFLLPFRTHLAINIEEIREYIGDFCVSKVSVGDTSIVDGSSNEHGNEAFELRHVHFVLLVVLKINKINKAYPDKVVEGVAEIHVAELEFLGAGFEEDAAGFAFVVVQVEGQIDGFADKIEIEDVQTGVLHFGLEETL